MRLLKVSGYKLIDESQMDSYEALFNDLFTHQLHISKSMRFGEDSRLDNKNCDLAILEGKFMHCIPEDFDRPLPLPGEKWKHFKLGKVVEIIGISEDTEWNTKSVVYRYEGNLWNRPLEMFMSEVDREKYPDATQKYRFERVVKMVPRCHTCKTLEDFEKMWIIGTKAMPVGEVYGFTEIAKYMMEPIEEPNEYSGDIDIDKLNENLLKFWNAGSWNVGVEND